MKSIKLLFMALLLIVSTAMAREEVNINFSNLQINDFIKLIGKITDRNILVHHKINGTVDLVTTAPIYDDEVLGILISVLESKGFTLVQKGSMYEVVRSSDATKHNLSVVRPGKAASGDIMVTQAIQVKEQDVDVIAAKIRYLISKTAKIMTMPASNTLLITDYPSNIETVKSVIKNLDKDNKTVISIVTVQYAELKGLHTQITEISKSYFNPKIEGEQVTELLNSDINSLIFIGICPYPGRSYFISQRLFIDLKNRFNGHSLFYRIEFAGRERNIRDVPPGSLGIIARMRPVIKALEQTHYTVIPGVGNSFGFRKISYVLEFLFVFHFYNNILL